MNAGWYQTYLSAWSDQHQTRKANFLSLNMRSLFI